ncbi:MAG: hypothetical protein IT573_01075 [Deltaproteobacteria bacterium]|nr:hypothetical protein [Deltaproteobacteria bacterium]
MLSKLASWIPQFLSPPPSDRGDASQQTPGGSDAPAKDVRPSAQKLMQRCMSDERENLRKRATMFLDAIKMHEADNNQAEVQELKKALGEVNKDLAELNKTCQEATKETSGNPSPPSAPSSQAGQEAKQTEEAPKAKPKAERKAKRKSKESPDAPKNPSPNGETLREPHGEMIFLHEIKLFNALPREKLMESLERYKKGEKIDLQRFKTGLELETIRVLPRALEMPKAEAPQETPKK